MSAQAVQGFEGYLGRAPDGHYLEMRADVATQPIGIIARRGAGKTHTAVVLAETMLRVRTQVIVLDPLGVWWGLRSSKDGKGTGFPVVVFGGDHGDIPLTEDMGAAIADVLVSKCLSAVVTIDHLSRSGQRRFAAAFLDRLYEAKRAQAARTPLHLIVDEADTFAPQRVQPEDARMLGAVDMIVRRGRVRGFGMTLITQRPATINKDVFTQIEVLIALQLTSPQDRKAVLEWVESHDNEGRAEEFMRSLAGLKRGEAWVWSPSWLNCFERIIVRDRQTFDSSATPKAGETPVEPKAMAAVDLAQLRAQFEAAVKTAEANDPKKLQARIRELEKQLAGTHFSQEQAEKIAREAVAKRDAEWRARVQRVLQSAANDFDMPAPSFAAAVGHGQGRAPAPVIAAVTAHPRQLPRPTAATRAFSNGDQSLGKGERAILAALAQAGRARSGAYVGLVAGYSSSSGTFSNLLSSLRTKGLIDGQFSALSITEAGIAAVGAHEPLPTGNDLIEFWCRKVGDSKAKILRAAAEAYPDALTYAEVGERTGFSAGSGTFSNYLSELRTLRLIEGRGSVRASAELMGGP